MLMNAPVAPLYWRMRSFELTTNKLPLGPNASCQGELSEPLPEGTNTPIGAPVMPLNLRMLELNWLDTYRFPSGPKVNPDGRPSPPPPGGTKLVTAPVSTLIRTMRLSPKLAT